MSSAANLVITGRSYDPNSGKCVYTFPSTFPVSGKEIGLVTATFNNSFFNVSSATNNNRIVVKFPKYTAANTFTWVEYTLVIPNGFYSISEFDQQLQHFCLQNGLYLTDTSSGRNVFFLRIYTNASRYSVQIDSLYLPTTAQIATLGWAVPTLFTTGIVNPGTELRTPTISFPSGVASTLGYSTGYESPTNAKVVANYDATPVSVLGTKVPRINPVTAILVRCNMVNSFFSNPSDVLGVCPVTAAFGAVNQMNVNIPTFTPAVDASYQTCEISFMDQDFNRLFMYDQDMTFTIQMRDAVTTKNV